MIISALLLLAFPDPVIPVCEGPLDIRIVDVKRSLFYTAADGATHKVAAKKAKKLKPLEVHSRPKDGFVLLQIMHDGKPTCVRAAAGSLAFDPPQNCSLPVCGDKVAMAGKSLVAGTKGSGKLCISQERKAECDASDK